MRRAGRDRQDFADGLLAHQLRMLIDRALIVQSVSLSMLLRRLPVAAVCEERDQKNEQAQPIDPDEGRAAFLLAVRPAVDGGSRIASPPDFLQNLDRAN